MINVITAEVRVSEQHDTVVIVPGHLEEKSQLLHTIRKALPAGKVRATPVGASLAALDSDFLLRLEAPIELRWTEDARQVAVNRQWVKRVHSSLYNETSQIRAGGRRVAETYLRDIEDLSVLDDHQWTNVAAMTLENSIGLCLFDEQGAGKTVTTIFAFDTLVARDQVDFALIVAPKSMLPEWAHDFQQFTRDLYKVQVMTGTRRQKRGTIISGADVLVTNYETAVSMESELVSLLRHYRGRAMLVVDESFFVKSLDAQRTRSLQRLREWCGRAFVLCGTPAPNAPQDLVQQFNLVDFGTTFHELHVPEERQAAIPVVQRAIEERGLYIRHLKANVLPNLPLRKFSRVLIPMEPLQMGLYENALKGLIKDLRATDDTTFQRQRLSFLEKRIRLLQICSNPASVVVGYHEVPGKLKALDQLLEELITKRGEKVIVWSFYTASLETIFRRYQEYNPVRYDGAVDSVAVRSKAVRDFQENQETMLFVGNQAAGGSGITLHRARVAIYESMSNQAAHFLQSLDRIHRRGQIREVEYVVLLCEDSLELTEYDRLTQKERTAHRLLRDQVEEPLTREMMLTEALEAARLLEFQP